MGSVALGLVAAMAWGLHDLCVRRVSQDGRIYGPILTVLAVGCALAVPASLLGRTAPSGEALRAALLSGALFGVAAIAHYRAFGIGPVRLVAPIIGAYPVLSIGLAALRDQPVGALDLAAVGIVIAGVGYVAAGTDDGETGGRRMAAILWSVAAGGLWAVTFAVGQHAAALGGELAIQAPTRLAALALVLVVALGRRAPLRPDRRALPVLGLMGLLDATALGAVTTAGALPRPEFASVAASTFGLVTVVLAAIFLREPLTGRQWLAVTLVFAAIAAMGL